MPRCHGLLERVCLTVKTMDLSPHDAVTIPLATAALVLTLRLQKVSRKKMR